MQKKRKKFLMLVYYRNKYDIRQADMAQLLGINPSSYSHKETGRVPVTFDEMLIIQKELNKRAKKAGDEALRLDEIFAL